MLPYWVINPPAHHHPISAVAGLLIAFGWPFLFLASGISSHRLTNLHDDVTTICAQWLVVLILAAIAFVIQRQSRLLFGLRMFGWLDLLWMLAALAATAILGGIATQFVRMPPRLTVDLHFSAVPFVLRLGLVLTAGFCEEFMYRGFGIEELAGFTRNRWIAGLVSLLLFTAAHSGLYGFSPALILPGIAGATITLLYLWRRNLPVCMLMHGIIDAVPLLIIPMVMSHRTH
jgi:membrane protease YdiL (CAAX protease family)